MFRFVLLATGLVTAFVPDLAEAALRAPYRPLATIRRADDIWKAKREAFSKTTTSSKGLVGVKKEEPAPTTTPPLPAEAADPGAATPRAATPGQTDGSSGTASADASPGTTAPPPPEAAPVSGPSAANFVDLMRNNAALLIRKALGAPYSGTFRADLEQGFSHEGFAYWILRQVGFLVPRNAVDMARTAGIPIDPRKLEPGDLLFFRVASASTNEGKIFVGIYLGDGEFAYPSYTAKKVVLSKFFRPFWQSRFLLARRVISELR